MSNPADADLVIYAVLMGFQCRRPNEKLMHHLERGRLTRR